MSDRGEGLGIPAEIEKRRPDQHVVVAVEKFIQPMSFEGETVDPRAFAQAVLEASLQPGFPLELFNPEDAEIKGLDLDLELLTGLYEGLTAEGKQEEEQMRNLIQQLEDAMIET